MKKVIWITFAAAIVLVNLIAELAFYYTGVYIAMIHRVNLILGICVIASVFVGSILLVRSMDGEKPLSGNVRDTLSADRKKS